MKKKIIISLIVIIVVALASTGVYFYFFKEKEIVATYQIAEKIHLDYEYVNYNDGILLLENEEKIGVFNLDGIQIIDFLYDEYTYNENGYVVLINNEQSILLDMTGKELFNTDKEIIILTNDTDTYFLIGKKNYDLYNESLEIVESKLNRYTEMVYNYLVSENRLYNIKTKLMTNIEYGLSNDKSYVLYDTPLKVINLKNDKVLSFDDSYFIMSSWGEMFFDNKKESLFVANDGEIYYLEEDYNNENYKVEKEECGYNIKDKDGREISTCSIIFSSDYLTVAYEPTDENFTILLENGKTIEKDFFKRVNDLLIISETQENYYNNYFEIYNLEGEKYDGVCLTLEATGDYYKCSNDETILLNNNFEKVSNGYEDINCEDDICIAKDKELSLLYKNEEYEFFDYNELFYEEEKVLAVSLNSVDIYKFKETATGVTNVTASDNFNININELINEYELSNIQKEINNNKELFLKFAYIITNNNELDSYTKEVLDIFPVIVNNKEYMNKRTLIDGLKTLEIKEIDGAYAENIAGLYYDEENKIELVEKFFDPNVLYHELLHFIDFKINNDKTSKVYVCDKKILEYEDFNKYEDKENCQINTPYLQFLVEAGAEIEMAKYFNEYKVRTYYDVVVVYSILNYIYGKDFMAKSFYAEDGNKQVIDKLKKSDNMLNIIKTFNDRANINYSSEKNNNIETIDYLIELYELERNNKWYEDELFAFLLSFIPHDYYILDESYNELYNEYITNNTFLDSILKDTVSKLQVEEMYYPSTFIIDGDIIFHVTMEVTTKLGLQFKEYRIDYNIDEGSFIVKEVPVG